MKIITQSPDFKATDTLIEFVQSNVQKLQILNEQIFEGRVSLTIDHSDTRENKVCEIRLGIPGNDLFASKRSKTFEEAVMKTIDALKHQLERLKTARESQRNS